MSSVFVAQGGISPWQLNQLSPIWTLPLIRDRNKVMDLTGVTTGQLALWVYNNANPKVKVITGTGTFAILQVLPGLVSYQLVTADLPTTAGQYWVRVAVNYNGTQPDPCDYISWLINP